MRYAAARGAERESHDAIRVNKNCHHSIQTPLSKSPVWLA
jgi:hypothetical protein